MEAHGGELLGPVWGFGTSCPPLGSASLYESLDLSQRGGRAQNVQTCPRGPLFQVGTAGVCVPKTDVKAEA